MPGPDPDPDPATPSEVKIRVRGFLQCPQTISITSLRKCLPDVTDFISGEWDRCVGGPLTQKLGANVSGPDVTDAVHVISNEYQSCS